MRAWIQVTAAAALAFSAAATAAGAEDAPLSAEQWREDITFVVDTIERVHPAPFARADEATFRAQASRLLDDADDADAEDLVVRLMRLVAMVEDGHTELDPSPMEPFASAWYPVRFYLFEDEVRITAVDSARADWVGARVDAIGGANAADVLRAAAALMGADNEFGAREQVYWASNAAVMRALGHADENGALSLDLFDADHGARRVSVAPLDVASAFHWRFYGEMYTPLLNEVESVGWGGHAPGDFWTGDATIPLFLRDKRAFHTEVLDEAGVVYFQFNYVTESFRDDTFADAYTRVFDALDADENRRLVLDIRYNFGGDGSILQPFVHEIIRRPRLAESGNLIIVTGRQTFSAAINLLSALVKNVDPVLVGEPAGAGHNAFGDADTFTLPNSGMELSVSTVLHVGLGTTGDIGRDARLIPVDFPTPMTAADYFAGRDPSMALVLGDDDLRSLEAIAAVEDRETVRRVYAQRVAAYGDAPWWRATGMWEMNGVGNALLAEGRDADDAALIARAVAALEINADVYPEWWNSWDSLAEAEMAAGRNDLAIDFYERSLELNPGNANARAMLEMLHGEAE